MTVEEVERGLGRLPEGRRRRDLGQRWTRLVDAFAESMVIDDLPAARQTAGILMAAGSSGRPMSLAGASIAGICLANGYQLATRNVSDFSAAPGMAIVNPFQWMAQ